MTRQVGCLAARVAGDLENAMVRPASIVFHGRDEVVFWVPLSTLVLLAAAFALTSCQLDTLVARRIDATDAELRHITGGDLDARVASEGTRELRDLSAGINVTVDAL